jgi:methylphosphotriester-DNA--protein-cysteine methyltransferase
MSRGPLRVNKCGCRAFQYVNQAEKGLTQFGRKNRIAVVTSRMYFGLMKQSAQMRMENQAADCPEAPRLPERRFWQAVSARDARYDGAFVYAVRSTGVYCRPSCPSRRPRRDRVVFFGAPEAAERQGFRACRRCDPRGVPGTAASRLIRQACQLMEQPSEDPIRVASVARQMGVSPFRLERVFRRMVGISPMAYAQSIRLHRFKIRLREGSDVTSALYEAGYGSSSRVYEKSNGHLGMTPATYGRGGQGMEIGYTTAPTHLGLLLVAGTVKGVSAIYLGDSEERLEAALRVSAAGLGSAAANSPGQYPELLRSGPRHWAAQGPARRGTRLCHQPGVDFDSLPSRGARGRRPGRVPRGDQTQTGVTCDGSGNARSQTELKSNSG